MKHSGWFAMRKSAFSMRQLLRRIIEANNLSINPGQRLTVEVTLKDRPKGKSIDVEYRWIITRAA